MFRRKLQELKSGADAGVDQAVVDDPIDRLDLDDASKRPQSRPRMRTYKAVKKQVPLTETVSIPRAGQEPWCPVLLMEPANKAPAMEVTTCNLSALFALVDAERHAVEGVRRPRHGTTIERGRAPRATPDGKEYFVRPAFRPLGHWVKKTKATPSGHGTKRPYAKRYTTLRRRRSDEADIAPSDSSRPRAAKRPRAEEGISDCSNLDV